MVDAVTSLDWLTDDDGALLTDDGGALLSVDEDRWFPATTRSDGVAYQLDVCTGFTRIGVADTFRFAGVNYRNAVGEWETVIPSGGVRFDGGASIDDVDSVILWDMSTRPASIVYAGSIIPPGTVTSGLTTTAGTDGTRWTLTGVDLYGLLASRLAYPTPTSEAPWVDAYDERTGVASTVAAGYIVDNMGTGALAARQVPGVTVVDGGVGASTTWTARLQPLSTLVASICNAAEIVCRTTMPTPGVIRYTLTTGADRTSQTVISERDLSGQVTVTAASARATHVTAGGSGELTARTFRSAASAASGIDRVESFYDVSTLTGGGAVSQAAKGSLAESVAETAVDFETLLPDRWRYQRAYDIGDTITVEVAGVRYPVLVDGVAFTIDPSRASVRPLLGRTTNNEATQIMRTLWGTSIRFAQNIT